MPVRSLNSSVLVWPKKSEVVSALTEHLEELKQKIKKAGYFGSYASGKWGVGSDIDIIIIVESAEEKREVINEFDPSRIPVPADLFVFSEEEFEKLRESPFWKKAKIKWIF